MSQFSAEKCISATDHPPDSPDLAPADFWLFPELKTVLKGKSFSDVEDIKSSVNKHFERHSCSKILKTVLNNGRSRNPKLTVMGNRCADHATPSIR
jgi:hypothetical protein